MGVAALEPDGRSKCWVVTRSLCDICIGMNAYKYLVIGRRDVAVRYRIHFYCLAVEAGFYSDVVECRTVNPADQVRSPVGENVTWIFSPFLLHLVASVGPCSGCEQQRDCLVGTGTVPSRFGGESI